MSVSKCNLLQKIPQSVQRENKEQSPSFSSPNFSKLENLLMRMVKSSYTDKTELFFQIPRITFVWVSTSALVKRTDGKIKSRRK